MSEHLPLLALTLPLKGRQLVEASAGTGKTWTLAALYVRLVLGHGRGGLEQGLWPPQILVVTFTDAATAELRDRIRHRLSQAAQAYALSDDPEVADEFLAQLLRDTPVAQWPACAQRLTQAVSWMDEAAIHTIHGWSMRALREHAFASRSLFDLQHLPDAGPLWLELARDHVRQFVYPLSDTALQALEAEGLSPDPQTWLDALSEPRKAHQRQPQPVLDPSTLLDPAQALAQKAAWLAQENTLLEAVRLRFDRTLVQAILNYKKSRAGVLGHLRSNQIEGVLARVMAWVEGHETAPSAKDLTLLGHRQMVERGWPEHTPHPALQAIDTWLEWQSAKPDSVKSTVLQHALHSLLKAYAERKAQAGLFDFHDLLERLYWALQDPAESLAKALREQYPVALVDEFQDTDPWQYGSLDAIYRPDSDTTLVLIGDPKQAIYSFRGADIDTYVKARQRCLELDPHSQHSLRQNRRSSPELLTALNALFGVKPDLFGPQIGFQSALSTPSHAAPVDTPVQVVISDDQGGLNAESHREFLLTHACEQMVQLLSTKQARPQDLAVLVRSHAQADQVMKALARSRIPAVYLSDRSLVYQSDEARDLWLVLRALAQPRRSSLLRAALGTPLWGLSEDALLHMTQSDEAWDRLLEQALRWHQHWLSNGVLPMLRQWLLDTGAAARLLQASDGERRLTNLLHLAELLQQATHPMTAQGIAALPHATVRHLGQAIAGPQAEDGPAQTRLESDDNRVRVVSFHKSKGLQYKHVFIPFLSSGSAAPEDPSDEDDTLERSRDVHEDTRLLYVAMTRAEQSLWLGVYAHRNEFKQGQSSALCRWLGRSDATQPWRTIWHDLSAKVPGLAVRTPDDAAQSVWQAPAPAELTGAPLNPPRLKHPPWWSASFSALTRQLGDPPGAWQARIETHDREIDSERLQPEPSDLGGQADGATALVRAAWQAFGAGARYGTILHDLLQWQAEHHWPLAQGTVGADWLALIERQVDLKPEERAMVTPWLERVLRTPLPMGDAPDLVLGRLEPAQYWAEMPFHFSAGPVSVAQMDALISADLFASELRPALMPAQLGGMVNGFIDLVFEHAGRYWVLDYKSNHLSTYEAPMLQTALLGKRYDVQSVIYLIALHRLLQHRVPNYEPQRHLGGAAYVFLRGIDTPGAGVVMQCPSVDLITTLDALLLEEAGVWS